MPMSDRDSREYEEDAQVVLTEAAQRLETLLAELAGRLRPFPSFLGMTSVQAVEVESPLAVPRDLGCVVVDPEGRLCRFDITAMSGIAGIAESDQVEEFQPLDLSSLEYVRLRQRGCPNTGRRVEEKGRVIVPRMLVIPG